ncbi:MAG: hypothetical protein NTV49_00485 [Kiritimatiellaeota bacterium]|nr:hypothetical protein [Kiritimatiellota bacterium]
MNKVEVDIGKWLQEAFDLYKDHFALLAITGVIGLLLSAVTMGILGGPMLAGLALILLRLLDKSEPRPQPGDLFKGFEFFLPSFLLTLAVAGASMLIGMIVWPLASVAALFLQTVTMFSIFLIVDRKYDFWPAILGSFDLVKINFWPLLALQLVALVLGGLGVFGCCVGLLVTWPFTYCVIAMAYRRCAVRGGEPALNPPPPPGAV